MIPAFPIIRSIALLWAAVVLMTAAAAAQADGSKLKPPAGHNVAIVVFEDMQCPDCRRAAPLVEEVSKAQNVPVVHYDFPLPMHNWAFDAHVWQRYFRGQSKELGEKFRMYIFENQQQLSPQNLKEYVQRFARDNNVRLPFVLDPQGKLAADVKADYRLGQQIKIEHTPTIFVVTNQNVGKPFVEVVDRSQLFDLVGQMKRMAEAAAAANPQKKPAAKTTSKKPGA
jgi:protein-disulfide isomerase